MIKSGDRLRMSGLQYTSFCWSDLHYLHVKCPLLHWVVPHSKLNHVGFSISIWIFRQKLKLINNKFRVLHILQRVWRYYHINWHWYWYRNDSNIWEQSPLSNCPCVVFPSSLSVNSGGRRCPGVLLGTLETMALTGTQTFSLIGLYFIMFCWRQWREWQSDKRSPKQW